MIISQDKLKNYVHKFNELDDETFVSSISNAQAEDWLQGQIPSLDCPDKDIEQTYYFRWWTFRKHVRDTPKGRIITEFLPDVEWAGPYNSISCAVGHHLYEGRWLRDPRPIREYVNFWYRGGGNLHSYSNWLPDALWTLAKTTGDFRTAIDLLPDLIQAHQKWETEHAHSSGLFWSVDDRDGMEFSISGSGLRTTLNCYMQANMRAISEIAALAGEKDIHEEFSHKAEALKSLIQERLWDDKAGFFRCIPLPQREDKLNDWSFESMDQNRVGRELWGYLPWYFGIAAKSHDKAWQELFSNQGFCAKYGLTSAERRHPMYGIYYTGRELFDWLKARGDSPESVNEKGHECLWHGPIWPYATTQAIKALASYLQSTDAPTVTASDYMRILSQYARSHRRVREDGVILPWIDENQHPDTGDWISRTRLSGWNNGTWAPDKGGLERGKDYNHSAYCDLVISGLFGLRPKVNKIEIRPLLSGTDWKYACLDKVKCQGHILTILYDSDGSRYNVGSGFKVFVNGELKIAYEKPQFCTIKLRT